MNYFKNNKSFRILKPIKSLLPENIKKIIKNDKRFNNNLNSLKRDWRNIVENEFILWFQLYTANYDKYSRIK